MEKMLIVIAQFVGKVYIAGVKAQTSVTGDFPTHCHLDGELFLFRVANPKGDVPSNLGF
jgi:hypothetical protein